MLSKTIVTCILPVFEVADQHTMIWVWHHFMWCCKSKSNGTTQHLRCFAYTCKMIENWINLQHHWNLLFWPELQKGNKIIFNFDFIQYDLVMWVFWLLLLTAVLDVYACLTCQSLYILLFMFIFYNIIVIVS